MPRPLWLRALQRRLDSAPRATKSGKLHVETFEERITPVVPPNDLIENAETIVPAAAGQSALSSIIQTIQDGTENGNSATLLTGGTDPTFGGAVRFNTVWFGFTPAATGVYTINSAGPGSGGIDTVLNVGTVSGGTFTVLTGGYNDDGPTGVTPRSQVTPTLNAGTLYYIQVGTYYVDTNALSQGNLQVSVVTPAVPPPNDDPANAIVLALGTPSAAVNLAAATTTSDPTNVTAHSGRTRSAWYSFTPATTGAYTFTTDTTDTNFANTILGLYSGAAGGPYTELGINDDIGGGASPTRSTLTQVLTAGVTYYLIAWANGTPTFPANVSVLATAGPAITPPAAPANDLRAGAVTVTLDGANQYTAPAVDIRTATTEGDPANQFTTLSRGRSIWYTFTPATSGLHTFTTASAGTTLPDTLLGVYTGTTTLTALATNDDGIGVGLRSQLSASLTAGTAYTIVVWQKGTAGAGSDLPAAGADSVSLRVFVTPIPANDTGGGAVNLTLNVPVFGTTLAAANDYQVTANTTVFPGLGQTTTTAADRDVVYRFTPATSGAYSFRVQGDGVFNPVLYVTDALPAVTPGTPVTVTGTAFPKASNRNSSTTLGVEEVFNLSLTAGTPYFIVVDGLAATIGNSFTLVAFPTTLEAPSNDTPATAQPFTPALTGVTGSITPAGEADFFSLGTVSAASRVFLVVDGAAGASNDFDARVTTATDTLEYDDLNGDTRIGGLAPVISGTPLAAGTAAFIRVNHFTASAQHEPYHLYAVVQPDSAVLAEVEGNGTPATANSGPSNYFSGTLTGPNPSTDVDVYKFRATTGDLVQVSLDGDPTRDNTPLDVAIDILDANGLLLFTINDTANTSSAGTGAGSLTATLPNFLGEGVAFYAPATGVYFARIRAGATSTTATSGDYLLSISVNGLIGGGITPPTLGGVTTTPQPVNDNATVSPFAGVTVVDPDSATVTVTVAYTMANGVFTNLGGFTGSAGSYTFTGTPAAAQTALRGLTFVPTANQVVPGSTTTTALTLTVTDSDTAPVTNNQTTVVSTSVNDAPTLSGVTVGPQAVNDTATVTPFAGMTFADVDPGQTYTVTVAYAAANGAFTNLGGFTGSAGSYTFTGTLAAAQTAIRGLAFEPADNRVTPGATEDTAFTVTLADNFTTPGTASNNQTTVRSTSVNDAPTVTGGVAGQTGTDAGTVTPFGGITIGDPDPGQTYALTVTIGTPANGTFSAASLSANGFTATATPGVFTRAASSQATAQAAVRALVFVPTANQVTPGLTVTTGFSVQATDNGPGPLSGTDSVTTVVITSANDAPTIAGVTATPQAISDTQTATPFAGVTFADVDPGQTYTVTVTYTAANGTLSSLGGFTGSAGSYTFTGTLAAAQTALRGLVFTPTPNQVAPGTTVSTAFTLALADSFATPGTASNNQTTVVATSVNDAPVITGTVAGQAVNDNATVAPFSAVSLGDPDVGQSFVLSVAIQPAGNGVFTPASLAAGGFTAAGGGVYTLSTTSGSVAQAALRGLLFDPTDDLVAEGTTFSTSFRISFTDSASAPVIDTTTTVITTSVNDAPTLSGVPTTPGAISDTAASYAPFTGATVTDPDSPNMSLSIQLSDPALGALSGGGFTASGGGLYTLTGVTASQATAALAAVRFAPAANVVPVGSTATETFTVTLSDGVAPPRINTDARVVITPVNDVPTIAGVSGTTVSVTDKSPAYAPFTGATVADPDAPTLTLSIQLSNAAYGAVSGGGFAAAGGGLYTLTGVTAAQANAALAAVQFAPAENVVPLGTTGGLTFTLSVSDGVAAPTSDNQATATITPVNDAPTAAGTAPASVTDKTAGYAPFAGATVGDVDSPSLNVSFTVSDPSLGAVTGGGFTAAGGGLYTLTGVTAAQANAALAAVAFAPFENVVPLGTTAAVTFALSVSDGLAPAVTNSGAVATVTPVNDAPALAGVPSTPVALTDVSAPYAPFAGASLADPDSLLSLSLRVSDPSLGSLSGGGTVDAGGGLYTLTGVTASQATAALAAVRFTPAANVVPIGTTAAVGFSLTFDDGLVAPVTNADASATVTPVNDAPALDGLVPSRAVDDVAPVTPFAGATLGDPDGTPVTVTVSLSTTTFGTLSGGFTAVGGGVYRFTGTPAAAEAALRGLVFTPAPNVLPPGESGLVTASVTVSDGATADALGTAALQVTSVNDTPVAVARTFQVAAGRAFDSGALSGLLLGATDADVGQVLSPVLIGSPSSGTLTLNADGSFTYTPRAGFTGTDTFTYGVTDGSARSAPAAVTLSVLAVAPPPTVPLPPGPPTVPGTPPTVPPVIPPTPNEFVAGRYAVTLGREVQVTRADGTPLGSFSPFTILESPGGVRAVMADVTGDGVPDAIAVTGPGAPVIVRVFDGVTLALLREVRPFEATFTGGATVSAGDIDGDGKAEVAVSPDVGGGPRVAVMRGSDGSILADFLAIEDPNFRGGARTAIADIDGDGFGELVVAAGFGGGPRVAVYRGDTLASGPEKMLADFFAFEPSLRDGVFLSAGDIDGDGKAEAVLGGGPGGGPRVFALSGAGLAAGRLDPVANFFAGDTSTRVGSQTATRDVNGDGLADLIAVAPMSEGASIMVYDGSTLDEPEPDAIRGTGAVFPIGGVYVG